MRSDMARSFARKPRERQAALSQSCLHRAGNVPVHWPFIAKGPVYLKSCGDRAWVFRNRRTDMKPQFLSFAGASLIAVGLLTGFSAPAVAGPAGMVAAAGHQSAAPAGVVVEIRDRGGYRGPSSRIYRRQGNWNHGGGGNWNHGGGGNWHRGGNWRHGGWNNGGNWHGGNGWRYNNYRPYRNYYYRDPSIYFGLGLPLYPYAAQQYYGDSGYYAPRRAYRAARLGSDHVEWCYNRYRSYRAYDNSFQPYNGPRQQCWSPY
jgi:hypothetical protein